MNKFKQMGLIGWLIMNATVVICLLTETDRVNAVHTVAECSDDDFLCNSTLECIPASFVCDGDFDCDDDSDEQLCQGQQVTLLLYRSR